MAERSCWSITSGITVRYPSDGGAARDRRHGRARSRLYATGPELWLAAITVVLVEHSLVLPAMTAD